MASTRKEEQLMQHSSGKAFLAHGKPGKPARGDKSTIICSHCKKPYHSEPECVVAHPHLKAALDKRIEKKRKDRAAKQAKLKTAKNTDSSEKTPSAALSMLSIRGCANKTFQPAFDVQDSNMD
ncbi:uncharacterized protein L3040_007815 [Drepanopeziza brunnea f. sp. 'multigermtubi']|uniref:uncharacterized protein n=1 Tax=Drepanopeziza brunnea f. sp. 'multigermtubi' TaxID=698441 RepID=UPI002392E2E2|nr:hypothetical protein L3040_007815 [Drepanopeziza brunnea f. sp. 'multigermtubi']